MRIDVDRVILDVFRAGMQFHVFAGHAVPGANVQQVEPPAMGLHVLAGPARHVQSQFIVTRLAQTIGGISLL